MKRYLLDTNVVLRFLRNDDPKQSPQAVALFAGAVDGRYVLRLANEVVAESEWVLRDGYKLDRATIATSLAKLIDPPCVECVNKAAVQDALDHYRTTTLDIVDCLLAAEAIDERFTLATFDKKIGKRIPGVYLWDQAEQHGV